MIPKEDRIVLERFFQYLLCENHAAYTLFGQKPISVAISGPSLKHPAEHMTTEKGWETWVRYRHLYKSNYFVLKRENFSQDDAIGYSFINKNQVLKIIRENLEDFQEVLGKETPEIILDKICLSEQPIFELSAPPPQKLIGLLLGYGKINAVNFEKELEIFIALNNKMAPPFLADPVLKSLNPLGKRFLEGYAHHKLSLKNKNDDLPTLIKEMKEIFETRCGFELSHSNYFLEKFVAPAFACWECLETAELRQSYEHTRTILFDAYKNRPFLEATLKQWTSPNESF